MDDSAENKVPAEPLAAVPEHTIASDAAATPEPARAETDHTPVRRVEEPAPAATVIIAVERRKAPRRGGDHEDRRDFFSEAMREALGPLSGIIERKINPLLAALEAIPDEVDHLTKVKLPAMARVLDQPLLNESDEEQVQERIINLPLAPGIANDEPRYLRPPGALPPGEFENVCSRCGKCVEVCPANAIQMDSYRMLADGLPFVRAVEGACVVCNDLACMPACPTGALKPLDRLQIRMGTARVDHQQCLRDRGEDCRLCVEACPITGAGASPLGEAIVIHAETGRVRVRKNICIGCGLCESRCPTEPRAIWVVASKGKADPIVA